MSRQTDAILLHSGQGVSLVIPMSAQRQFFIRGDGSIGLRDLAGNLIWHRVTRAADLEPIWREPMPEALAALEPIAERIYARFRG